MQDVTSFTPGAIIRHLPSQDEYLILAQQKIKILSVEGCMVWRPGLLYAGKTRPGLYSRTLDDFNTFELVRAAVLPQDNTVGGGLSFEVKCDIAVGLLDSITADNRSSTEA